MHKNRRRHRSLLFVRHHLYSEFSCDFFRDPMGGYTIAHIPVCRSITVWRHDRAHASVNDRCRDPNEGNYLPKDTSRVTTGYTSWSLMTGGGHMLHVSLAPMNSHQEFRQLDSTYFGTLGYAFFKQFMTVLDYKKRRFRFTRPTHRSVLPIATRRSSRCHILMMRS